MTSGKTEQAGTQTERTHRKTQKKVLGKRPGNPQHSSEHETAGDTRTRQIQSEGEREIHPGEMSKTDQRRTQVSVMKNLPQERQTEEQKGRQTPKKAVLPR